MNRLAGSAIRCYKNARGISKYLREFSHSSIVLADYSHVVIGGGVVGLAVAAELSKSPGSSVLLVERNSQLGTETSSRNSEVIHAGLYHPLGSLRTDLCIRGKRLLYELGDKNLVELKRCAQNEQQHQFLENMYKRGQQTGVPLEWVTLEVGRQLEPAVIAQKAILNSPSTGIISAHSLMAYLEGQALNNGADISVETQVHGLETIPGSKDYAVLCKSSDQQTFTIKAESVINSAGLYAPNISNMLLPPERHYTAYYAKGNYFSYGASSPKVQRLIYPCPSDHASLGTHLTIDLAGRIKFGPDIEWVSNCKHSFGHILISG